MEKRISRLMIVVSFFVLVLMLPSLAKAQTPSNLVRIGLGVPLEWPQGKSMLWAAQKAIREINEAGGILGRKLELIVGDTEGKADVGSSVVDKFIIRDKVSMVTAGYSSEEGLAEMDVCCDHKVISISAGYSTPKIRDRIRENYKRYKYFFRVMPHSATDQSDYMYDVMIPFIIEALKSKLSIKEVKIAVIVDMALYADPHWERAMEMYPKLGYDIVYKTRVGRDAVDFTAELNSVKNSGAQLISYVSGYKGAAPFSKQWYDMKVPAVIAGMNVYAMSSKWWEQTEGKGDYAIIYNIGGVRAPITPKTIPFFDAHTKELGFGPYYCTVGAYNSIYAYADAVQRAGTFDADAVVSALESINLEAVGGVITFSKLHDIVRDTFPIVTQQWQKGRMETLFPKKFKTAEFILPNWMVK